MRYTYTCTKNTKCNTSKSRETQLTYRGTPRGRFVDSGEFGNSREFDLATWLHLDHESFVDHKYVHSYGADSFSLLTLLPLLDISPSYPLSLFLFFNMFLSFRSFLFLCFLLGPSFSHTPAHSLCPFSVSFLGWKKSWFIYE